jgi:RHS repeat-associated protein
VATGGLAADNTFRFSTKQIDPESGLYYFGYRDFGAGLGRWTSRDPIGENGGGNLYAAMLNRPVDVIDILGMAGATTHGIEKCLPGDDCAKLTSKIKRLVASLAERRSEMEPYSISGQSWENYVGHAIQVQQQFTMLINCFKLYEAHKPPCCGNAPFFNPFPLPGWKPEPYRPPVKEIETTERVTVDGTAVAAGVGAVVVVLVIKKAVGVLMLPTPAAPAGVALIVTP